MGPTDFMNECLRTCFQPTLKTMISSVETDESLTGTTNSSPHLFSIGVGAGRFFGVRRISPRISPNLPRKFLCDFCLRVFSHKDHEDVFLVWPPKKRFSCVFLQALGAIFERKQRWGHFSRSFRDFAQIFRDFARIFNKSKLLGVRLHTRRPCSSHWLSVGFNFSLQMSSSGNKCTDTKS